MNLQYDPAPLPSWGLILAATGIIAALLILAVVSVWLLLRRRKAK
jgi:hypothetical protein